MSSRCHKAPAPFKGQSYRLGACEEIKRTAHDQRQSEETDSFGNEDHSRALLVAAHQPIPEEARHLPPFFGKKPAKNTARLEQGDGAARPQGFGAA